MRPIRRRERAGGISAEDAAAALDILRMEAARMVQQPLNPAVLEAARQLLDRTTLRWPDTLQLGAAAGCARYVSRHRDHLRLRHRCSCWKPPGPRAFMPLIQEKKQKALRASTAQSSIDPPGKGSAHAGKTSDDVKVAPFQKKLGSWTPTHPRITMRLWDEAVDGWGTGVSQQAVTRPG